MKKSRLVIAKYHEDLSWLNIASKYDLDVTVYDKSNENLKNPNDLIKINDNNFFVSNFGREANTYIRHIILNYDKLYDIEIFSQGRVYDHIPNFWGNIENINLNKNFNFHDFSPTRKISCLNEESYQNISQKYPLVDINDRGSGSYIFLATDGHRKIYELAHGYLPESNNAYFEFGCHGIFAVSAEKIREIPLDSYYKMLELLTGDDHIFWSYEFEYSWKLIFSDKI